MVLPSRGGLGGVGFVAAEATSQITGPSRKIPPQVHPRQTEGWTCGGSDGPLWRGPPNKGHLQAGHRRRARRRARPQHRAAAPLRLACHQAQRLARRASGCEPIRAGPVPFRLATAVRLGRAVTGSAPECGTAFSPAWDRAGQASWPTGALVSGATGKASDATQGLQTCKFARCMQC